MFRSLSTSLDLDFSFLLLFTPGSKEEGLPLLSSPYTHTCCSLLLELEERSLYCHHRALSRPVERAGWLKASVDLLPKLVLKLSGSGLRATRIHQLWLH